MGDWWIFERDLKLNKRIMQLYTKVKRTSTTVGVLFIYPYFMKGGESMSETNTFGRVSVEELLEQFEEQEEEE